MPAIAKEGNVISDSAFTHFKGSCQNLSSCAFPIPEEAIELENSLMLTQHSVRNKDDSILIP
jgi:hypothetical protein